jgi:hypothetical protein
MVQSRREDVATKRLHIAWTGFQRRQITMADFMGFECIFVGPRARTGLARLFDYLWMTLKTLLICVRSRPYVVWMQVPPTPIVFAVSLATVTRRRRVIMIADCHNSMLRPPWSSAPLSKWLLKQCDIVVFHNADAAQAGMALGIDLCRIRVLEDAPVELAFEGRKALKANTRVQFLFPASFSADEPIETVLAVAAQIPEADFKITGNYAKRRGSWDLSKAGPNVRFTGFLSLAEFDEALAESDIVLALTSMEGVQLSACNEAVGAGKPMVMSATRTLQKLFPRGNVPCANAFDVSALLEACRDAIARLEPLAQESSELREERRAAWRDHQAAPIAAEIEALLAARLTNRR